MLLAQGTQIADRHVYDLPSILRAGDRLILNDTKVIPARLTGQRWRDTAQGRMSAKIEVTLLELNAVGAMPLPPYMFQLTDGLMTNFHLPKSTLMMLVSALMGVDQIKAIYGHALAHDYRFFSYGDSSVLLPG